MFVLLATRMRMITKCNRLLLFHGEINSCVRYSRVIQYTFIYVNGPLQPLEECLFVLILYSPHSTVKYISSNDCHIDVHLSLKNYFLSSRWRVYISTNINIWNIGNIYIFFRSNVNANF